MEIQCQFSTYNSNKQITYNKIHIINWWSDYFGHFIQSCCLLNLGTAQILLHQANFTCLSLIPLLYNFIRILQNVIYLNCLRRILFVNWYNKSNLQQDTLVTTTNISVNIIDRPLLLKYKILRTSVRYGFSLPHLIFRDLYSSFVFPRKEFFRRAKISSFMLNIIRIFLPSKSNKFSLYFYRICNIKHWNIITFNRKRKQTFHVYFLENFFKVSVSKNRFLSYVNGAQYMKF